MKTIKPKPVAILVAVYATVTALCLFAEAQQLRKIPRVGYLALRAGPSEADQVFLQALRGLGYIDGENIKIEYRWAAGDVTKLPNFAEELVRLDVDMIVAWATPAVQAAKDATKTIPIVMTGSADPVGTGFVASLARPGGNITGMSSMLPELAGKRLELLKDIVPKLSRVAFLAHGGDPAHKIFVKQAQDAGTRFRIQIQPVIIGGSEEIDAAFSIMTKSRSEALIVQTLFIGNPIDGRRIVDHALSRRLPAVSDGTRFADLGGLLFYGPNPFENVRRAATYVDKIFKGAKPAEFPVEQPMKFELVINLKTAKQIDVTIPASVLARADL